MPTTFSPTGWAILTRSSLRSLGRQVGLRDRRDETNDRNRMGARMGNGRGADIPGPEVHAEANPERSGDIRAKLFAVSRRAYGGSAGGIRPADLPARSALALC